MKKDLYDKTINFDYSKLPNELQEMIKEKKAKREAIIRND